MVIQKGKYLETDHRLVDPFDGCNTTRKLFWAGTLQSRDAIEVGPIFLLI